jgi:hypothetical protein
MTNVDGDLFAVPASGMASRIAAAKIADMCLGERAMKHRLGGISGGEKVKNRGSANNCNFLFWLRAVASGEDSHIFAQTG